MAEVIRRALTPFAEVAALRSIRVDTALTTCMVRIDPGLADILVNNLIKNGVKHNIDNGYLTIRLDANELQIENSGLPYEGNPEALLERFARGSHGNSGIGLAIVREICELYRFRLSYTIDQLTTHKIRISFS
jgi:signal transduction histidine kinase